MKEFLSLPIKIGENYHIILNKLENTGCLVFKEDEIVYHNQFLLDQYSIADPLMLLDKMCTFSKLSIKDCMKEKSEFSHTAKVEDNYITSHFLKVETPESPDYTTWLLFSDDSDFVKISSFTKMSNAMDIFIDLLNMFNNELEDKDQVKDIRGFISPMISQILDNYNIKYSASYFKIDDEFVFSHSFGDIDEAGAIVLTNCLNREEIRSILRESEPQKIVNMHQKRVKSEILENIDILYPLHSDSDIKGVMIFKFSRYYLLTEEIYHQLIIISEIINKMIFRSPVIDKQTDIYETLLDLSEDSITLHSKGILTYANMASLKIFKATSQDDLIGRNVLDFVHPDSLEMVKDRLDRMRRGETVEKWVFEKFWALDGSVIETRVSAKSIKINNAPYIVVIIKDITAESMLQKEIALSEQKYQALVDSSPDPVLILQNDVIIFGNPKVAELFETAHENVMGRKLTDFIPNKEIETTKKFFTSEYKVERYNQIIPLNIITEKNNMKNIEISMSPIFYENEPADLVMVRDRTFLVWARKQVEEKDIRYRELFNNSSDPIYVSSHEGYFIDFNRSFLELFGYSREEMGYINVKELYQDPNDRIKLTSKIDREGYVSNYELELKNKQGRKLICKLTTQGIKSEGAGDIMYQGIIRDITEERVIEQATLVSQKLESLGILAGGIAHDFNNLLMGILTSSSLAMKYATEDTEISKLLDMIHTTSRKAAVLVDQLLAYAGEARIRKEQINLSKLVEELNSIIHFTVPPEIKVIVEYGDKESIVQLDVIQIEQVIMNLIRNSIDAIEDMNNSSGEIRIITKQLEIKPGMHYQNLIDMQPIEPGVYTILEIRDNGSGIDPDKIAQIFDPFFSTKFTGRGLGLAATMGIIKGHNALIVIDTTKGEGTSFSIFFPIDHNLTLDPKLPDDKDEVTMQVSNDERDKNKTILIVDDEPLILKIVSKLIKTLGYKTVVASGGEVALQKINEKSIDLIILDLTMPGMSGKECFVKIKEINTKIPIIISSGYTESESLELFDDDEVDGFLHKPYLLEDLQNIIEQSIQIQ